MYMEEGTNTHRIVMASPHSPDFSKICEVTHREEADEWRTVSKEWRTVTNEIILTSSCSSELKNSSEENFLWVKGWGISTTQKRNWNTLRWKYSILTPYQIVQIDVQRFFSLIYTTHSLPSMSRRGHCFGLTIYDLIGLIQTVNLLICFFAVRKSVSWLN